MGGAYMRIVQRLLRRVDLAGDDARLLEFGECLVAIPPGAPFAHPGRDDLAVIGAALVVGKAWLGEPVLGTDHAAPTAEHRLADDADDDPPILGAKEVA